MTALNIKAFKGKVPRTSPRLLDGNFATEALNCKLTSGRLDPLKGLSLTHTSLASAIATLWRYRNAGVDYWLVWGSTVDAVRSPVSQDKYNRVYFTGDGEPRMAAFADAIAGGGPYPAAWYTLGVYIPTTAPTCTSPGGSGTQETRAYVYTFVTQYGEESAPSPAILQSGFQTASWNVASMEVAPPNSGTVTAAVSLGGGQVQVTLDTNRGLAAYEQVTFASVTGMTDLNQTLTIASVSGTNQVVVNLTTAQTYTSGGTWARRAPHNTANMKKRIYRSVGTNANYFFVAEITAATTSYADNVASTALGGTLPTLTSWTPPKNGHSLIALANGVHVMLAGNEVCFSEFYKPHSYPIGNRYAFSGQGVTQVASGTSAIVLTDSYPLEVNATSPDAATPQRMPTYAPCVSKRGTVDIGGAALYPSHDGMYVAAGSDAQNVTKPLYTYDEWTRLTPASFNAAFHDQRYFARHTGDGTPDRILMLDLRDNMAAGASEVDERVDALYTNPYDGHLYAAKGNLVYQWDADDTNRYLSFWQSAEFQFGKPVNFTCAKVQGHFADIVPANTSVQAANAALLANADNITGAFGDETGVDPWGATNLLDTAATSTNSVQLSIVKDGAVVYSAAVTSAKPFRVPSGLRAEAYQVQIASSIPIYSVTVAQSMHELGATS